MFSLFHPSRRRLTRFLASEAKRPFSYDPVGASRNAKAPVGKFVNNRRERLGKGSDVYARACAALSAWRMFPDAWIRVHSADTEIKQDAVVAVAVRCLGVWTINACRIVYVLDKCNERECGEGNPGEMERFGFGYGALIGHPMHGEERFLVEWDRYGDDAVFYDVWSFSWPQTRFARCIYPYIRRVQQRFVVDSAAAIRAAVHGSLE